LVEVHITIKAPNLAIIAVMLRQHPVTLRIIDNTGRTIPSAINCAIQASIGEIIIRVDAHSQPYPNYIERCLTALDANLGDNVGGVWEIKPGGKNWIAGSIAVAAAHPLGVGDAGYRIGTQASAVDTVPFGAFRRELVERIGMLNESLLSNEDYEFNVRIRKSGGKIWLDPSIETDYFSRPTLIALIKQYWRYGYWKRQLSS